MALLAETRSFDAPDYDATAEQVALTSSYWGSEAPKTHLLVAGTSSMGHGSPPSTTPESHIRTAIGWATNSDECTVGIGSADTATTSHTGRVHTTAYCTHPLYITTHPTSYVYERAVQYAYASVDLDYITGHPTYISHTWSESANDGYDYFLLGLGGDDVTDVSIDTIDTATSTGDVSYTGPGFKPDFLIAIYDAATALSTDVDGLLLITDGLVAGMGMSDGTTDACAVGASMDDLTTSHTTSSLSTDFIRIYHAGSLATLDACTVKSLDSSGYTLTWGTANATAYKVSIIAIKGPAAKVVTATQPTTDTTNDVSAGFVPKAGMVLGSMKTASSSTSIHNRFVVGAWDEEDNMSCVGWMDQCGQTSTNCGRFNSGSRSIVNYNHADTVVGQATVAVQGNGIRETWANTDGTQYQHAWLLLGDTPPISTNPAFLSFLDS